MRILTSSSRPIAFYAPLKHPGHAIPSGDREVARMLLRALSQTRFGAQVVSTFTSLDAKGNAVDEAIIEAAAEADVQRLQTALPCRPAAWVTYHNYYKAPDLLGPAMSQAWGIPYVLVEASHAEKRMSGPWARFAARSAQASRSANLHIVLNRGDIAGLQKVGASRFLHLPPFLAPDEWPQKTASQANNQMRLLAVGMMRPGDKLASYAMLAEALRGLDGDWLLDIVGDGAAQAEVHAQFEPFESRIRFHGKITDRSRLAQLYAQADVLAWPGVNEAFGMAYLEAAACGLPAVAGAYGGVAEVVENGISGMLSPVGDVAAYRQNLALLLGDAELRHRLGINAREKVLQHHSLPAAAHRLELQIAGLLAEQEA
ncbi:glycosyltransferase family 4 protein [Aureimonas fodinaquatilis]|nr:glycosyltransferase family 4 protein [Aureimonas fodinaquatilis]